MLHKVRITPRVLHTFLAIDLNVTTFQKFGRACFIICIHYIIQNLLSNLNIDDNKRVEANLKKKDRK